MPEAHDSLKNYLSVQLQPALGTELLSVSFMHTRTTCSTHNAQMGHTAFGLDA